MKEMKHCEPFALITGASEGIGRAIAIRVSSLGYNVALMSRNALKLEETAQLCKKVNDKVKTRIVACDIANVTRLTQCLEEF